MKTFRWTVPVLPLTKREQNPRKTAPIPGVGKLLYGVFTLLMGIFYLSPGEFINGLRTYFWESAQAVVTEADVQALSEKGRGTVTYQLVIDGETVTSSTYLQSSKPPKKLEDWAVQYSPGNEVTVYYHSKDLVSLGHWPTAYVAKYNLVGIGWIGLAIWSFWGGASQFSKGRRDTRAAVAKESATATAC